MAELQFLPSLYYITWLTRSGSVILEQYENYNKRSFRNKCIVNSNRKNQYLIIPLKKGKHQSQPIREVEISYDEDWPRIMKNRLQTEYGNYPYFLYYIEDILRIVDQKHIYLFDLNAALLEYIFRLLHLDEIFYTTNYTHEYQGRVLDLRDKITPGLFNVYPELLAATQVGYFSFTPGHSFLEALFSYGPEIELLVDQYRKVLPSETILDPA